MVGFWDGVGSGVSAHGLELVDDFPLVRSEKLFGRFVSAGPRDVSRPTALRQKVGDAMEVDRNGGRSRYDRVTCGEPSEDRSIALIRR
jgi:hypothetical protein